MAVIKIEEENQSLSASGPAELSPKKKMIYMVLTLVCFAGAFYIIYSSFFASKSTPPLVEEYPQESAIPSVAGPQQSPDIGQQITFESFKAFIVEFKRDMSVVNDPKYQLLKPLGITVPVVTSGRANPFLRY